MARERALVLVRIADASALGRVCDIVRANEAAAVFCPNAAAVLDLPPRSTAVLWLRPEDLPGLNLARELFRERSLRVVIVAISPEADLLRDEAPDLYDWIAHRFDLSAEAPEWVVANVRAALTLGGRISWWGPGPVDAALRTAHPSWDIHRADATASWTELLEAAHKPGWRVWEGARYAWHETRVRWAEATVGAAGAAILDRPGLDLPGWWRIHQEVVAIEAASDTDWGALLASGAEPEALGRAVAVLPEEPAWARAWPLSPERAACAARLTGGRLRALDPAAVEAERRGVVEELAGELGRGEWPAIPLLPVLGPSGQDLDVRAIVEGIGRLSEHSTSFLIERAIRDGVGLRERIEAAVDAGHLDVANDWIPSLPVTTPAERVWRGLLELLVKEGEATFEDVPALEGLVEEADATGDAAVRAAVRYRLGQALNDAGMASRALRALRGGYDLQPRPDSKLEIRLAEANVLEQLVSVGERQEQVNRALSEASAGGDEVRAAKLQLIRWGLSHAIGRRAEASRWESNYLAACEKHLLEPHPPFEAAAVSAGARARSAEPWAARQGRAARMAPLAGDIRAARTEVADTLARISEGGSPRLRTVMLTEVLAGWSARGRDVDPGAVALRLLGESELVGDVRAAALGHAWLGARALVVSDWAEVRRHFGKAAATFRARGESRIALTFLRGLALAAVSTDSRDLAAKWSEEAWQLCRDMTDPDARGGVVELFVPLLLPSADPRIPKLLEETLAYADKYPDDESAWVRPRMLKLAEESLTEARKNLHRARSTRDKEAARRWDVLERRLEKLLRRRGA